MTLNLNFYPALSSCDGGTQAGRIYRNQPFPIFACNAITYNAEFYSNNEVLSKSVEELKATKGHFFILADEASEKELLGNQLKPIKREQIQHFTVTMPSLPFIYPKMRQSVLRHRYLLEVEQ